MQAAYCLSLFSMCFSTACTAVLSSCLSLWLRWCHQHHFVMLSYCYAVKDWLPLGALMAQEDWTSSGVMYPCFASCKMKIPWLKTWTTLQILRPCNVISRMFPCWVLYWSCFNGNHFTLMISLTLGKIIVSLFLVALPQCWQKHCGVIIMSIIISHCSCHNALSQAELWCISVDSAVVNCWLMESELPILVVRSSLVCPQV